MPTHQFLIASYRKDFEWLRVNLRSLAKFSIGFKPPAVVVTTEDYEGAKQAAEGLPAEIHILDGPGFARAQIAMMHGDKYCCEADYVYLTGSDCMAIRPFDFTEYWRDGKPIMLYNSWTHLGKCGAPCMFWKAGTEKALGGRSQNEFMRRLPIAYPYEIYAGVRTAIEKRHKIPFFNYVVRAVNGERNFSESNVLGEWCWRHARQKYSWHCLDTVPYEGASAMTQFWSHGGMDRPSDRHGGRSPRAVIQEILG